MASASRRQLKTCHPQQRGLKAPRASSLAVLGLRCVGGAGGHMSEPHAKIAYGCAGAGQESASASPESPGTQSELVSAPIHAQPLLHTQRR